MNLQKAYNRKFKICSNNVVEWKTTEDASRFFYFYKNVKSTGISRGS